MNGFDEYGNYGENNPPIRELDEEERQRSKEREEKNKGELKLLQFPTPTETDADIDVDKVLESAKSKLKATMVLGFTKDNQFYFAMSQGSIAENLLILETARLILNEVMLGAVDDE